MQQGKVDEAIAQLQALEAEDPAAKGLALELGTAYYKKSDFVKAIEYLKKATAADPANGEATQLLGLSYYLGGHPADAIPLAGKSAGLVFRGPMWMLPTFLASATSRRKITNRRARRSPRCSMCRPTRPPAICSRRAC